MAKENNEISFTSAVKVADLVEMQSIKLLACDCKQKPKRPAGPKSFDIKKNTRFQLDKKNNIVGVFIRFELKAFGKENERKKNSSFLDINATFLLLYSIKSFEGLDENAYDSFANLNGPYNAWPYWREFVQNITCRMELPPLTIPVYRFVKSPVKAVAQKNESPKKS